MATASDGNDIFDSVEPKGASTRDKLDEIRNKAYIPTELPKDFLRVILNQQQLDETNDTVLAHRLQYSMEGPYSNFSHDLNSDRARAFAATLGRGRLQLDIMEARLTKNYGFTKMDPYVRVKIGSKIYESPTDYGGGKNPKWRKTLMCYLPHNVDTILIEVYDEKSFTNDELVAFVKFPLPDALFQGSFVDEWIPLSGKLGEQKEGHINIQALFTPIENLHNNPHQNAQKFTNKPSIPASASASSSSSSTHSPISPSHTLNQPRVVQLPPDPSINNSSSAGISPSTNQNYHSSYSPEVLENLKDMFPSFDTEVIKSILDSNHGNKEATLEALLQISTDN